MSSGGNEESNLARFRGFLKYKQVTILGPNLLALLDNNLHSEGRFYIMGRLALGTHDPETLQCCHPIMKSDPTKIQLSTPKLYKCGLTE